MQPHMNKFLFIRMFIAVLFLLTVKVNIVEAWNCTLRADSWLHNTTVHGMEYYVSKNVMSFPECISYCSHLGNCAHLAEYIQPLVTIEFLNGICLTNLTVWIQKIDFTNRCYVLSNRSLDQSSPCESTFRCLCQRRTDKDHSSETIKLLDGYDFCLDYKKRFYQMSAKYCKCMWNSSVIGYRDPMKYIKLPHSLVLKKGSYWLNSDNSSLFGGKCLALQVVGEESYLHVAECRRRFYSICTSLSNATDVLAYPYFVQMLRNMTVNKQQTNNARSELTSANDDRVVAKVLGGLGITVIVLILGLLVVTDLGKLGVKCKQRQCCKQHTAKVIVQPVRVV